MFDDDILVSVADRGAVAEMVVQRTWNAVAVEVAEIAVCRYVLSLNPVEELGIHIVKLMERIGRVRGLQEQCQRQGPVGPACKMLLLVVGVWHADTDIAEVVVEAIGHNVVGRTDVWQWVLEILVQPRGEEI